jgi:trehalose 6-phosphate synthase
MTRVIIVSNRTPGSAPAAGGLAVALKKTLADRDGFWFGWSGAHSEHRSTEAKFQDTDGLRIASVDITRQDFQAYYAGYANSILWPAFHLRLDLATFESHWYEGYRKVNAQFAEALMPHLRPDDLIWVNDYHLIPLASELRSRGAKNRIGFYLHIPFPTPDALFAIPFHNDLLVDLTRYNIIGLQAQRDVAAFEEAVHRQAPPRLGGAPSPRANFSRSRVMAIPIGSDPEAFAALATKPSATKMANRVRRALLDRALILGVDRLDYSKGLPQRIEAYEKLLLRDTGHRRKVHMMQIAPPSRDSIKEYRETSDALDAICGRVMGRFSEPDWQPLTYVKRPYSQATLAGIYRLARVGLVTPLRDGMNLVAHEFVASQDPEDPGVLVLSRFAGAAEIFPDAVQVNPFDTDETARALSLALAMPLAERKQRWENLFAAAKLYSIDNWARAFLEALAPSQRPKATDWHQEERHMADITTIYDSLRLVQKARRGQTSVDPAHRQIN